MEQCRDSGKAIVAATLRLHNFIISQRTELVRVPFEQGMRFE